MGKIVHTYELLEQLGQGGMGVVYKARHIHFNEIYALKRLWEQYSKNPAVLKLFLNEGVTLRGLSHKNIVRVYDLFSISEDYYIVMEYIQGRTLSEIIKRETGPIYRERAIRLFKQMLEGISYIHSRQEPIIHRDIKPLNVLVTADDTVKITDFGIAKALDTGGGHASTVVKGTPVYMSPEQIISPSTIDIRTDVYSLGMTFYEMLCGHTPFETKIDTTPTAVYAAIMMGEVPPPTSFYHGISDALSDFVMKAIHKDRNQRFANANEMLVVLDSLERGGKTTVQGDNETVPPVFTKPEVVKQPVIEPRLPETKRPALPKKEEDSQQKESSNAGKRNAASQRAKERLKQSGIVAGVALLILIIWYALINFNQKVEIPQAADTASTETIMVDTLRIQSVQGDWFTYTGPTARGKANGHGDAIFDNGNKYSGAFVDNKRNGKGVFVFAGGGSYDGDWGDDRMAGYGKYVYEDGSYYVGDFKNDMFNGKGTYFDKLGNVLQDGYWVNDSLTSR